MSKQGLEKLNNQLKDELEKANIDTDIQETNIAKTSKRGRKPKEK